MLPSPPLFPSLPSLTHPYTLGGVADAIDFDLLKKTLQSIVDGEPVDIPLYDFGEHNRVGVEKRIERADVIVLEGIFALYDEGIRDLMDLKVFVDSDSDTRLARRVRRDMAQRDRTLASVLDQYEKYVKPAFDVYIAPTKRYANIILPQGTYNEVGIELIALHIRMKLEAMLKESGEK